jgi:cytochrome c biogenesis protein
MADPGSSTTLVADAPTISKARANSNDVIDRLWRLLSSVKFAIVLITLIAVGVLAGTLIMQAPNDVLASPASYEGWLSRTRVRYGEPWATIFAYLDLYRVFSSFWFRSLLAVLTLSVVVCTVNRMPGIVANARRPTVKVPERLFERAPLRAAFTIPGITPEQAQLQASKVLGAQRFRVVPWDDGSAKAVFADKNRFGKYGTFLNHVGIVTILGAAVLGGAFGWREDGFMVPEGSMREVGHATALTVRSDAFIDEYYANGTPKDFRSDLVLFESGTEVARKTIRVNDPLDYNGIRFHQAFFGPAAVIRVTDAQGQVIHDDGVALGWEFASGGISRNGGFFTLNNRRLAVYVLLPAAQRGPDPDIPAGSVRLEIFEPRQPQPSAIETLPQGEERQILGYTFEFLREKQFSGLQISYNPAIDAIWFASACMVLGIIAVFYFPLRRLWVRADVRPDGGGITLRVAAIGNRDVLFSREFETLALAIEKEVAGVAHLTAKVTPTAKSHAPDTAPTSRTQIPVSGTKLEP